MDRLIRDPWVWLGVLLGVVFLFIVTCAPTHAKPRTTDENGQPFHFKDVCHNIKNKQTIYDVRESHVFRFVGKHKCVRVTITK